MREQEQFGIGEGKEFRICNERREEQFGIGVGKEFRKCNERRDGSAEMGSTSKNNVNHIITSTINKGYYLIALPVGDQ